MIDYNLILYIGLGLIIGGFCLFLYSEHRLRQLDIEQWKLNQSFNKAKEMEKTWGLAKKIVSRRYKK
jgi:hypothetical protein